MIISIFTVALYIIVKIKKGMFINRWNEGFCRVYPYIFAYTNIGYHLVLGIKNNFCHLQQCRPEEHYSMEINRGKYLCY